MTDIKIEKLKAKDGKERIYLTAPYHYATAGKARLLHGIWLPDSKRWAFDTRDEDRVRRLCVDVYGTDGSEAKVPTVTVQVVCSHPDGSDALADDSSELWLLGRQLLRRRTRDSEVSLGDGVVVVSGGFANSGGSANHPRIAWKSGTVLEVRDVPVVLADRDLTHLPEILSVVDP